MERTHHRHAWVVTVDMGYGHERAAHALNDVAYGDFIVANNYPGIPASDRKLWAASRRGYEMVSRFKSMPIVGDWIFNLFDRFQQIKPFYPRRDLSKPSLQVLQQYYLIEKRGLGRDLIDKLRKRMMPLICTFFLPAFAAEVFDYPEDIYLVTTDADISRAWVPKDPKRSRIKYFASNGRVVERLKLYGVLPENIYLTGFPLSKQLIGGADPKVIKQDLGERICHLDPNGIFVRKYSDTLGRELGLGVCKPRTNHVLTLTFAVGGAGAQRELGIKIARSLREKIRRGRIVLNLVAGTHRRAAAYFKKELKSIGLGADIGKGVNIHLWPDRKSYFPKFDLLIRRSDILWTKPSELSFYTGVGLPIIAAPPIGSQEKFNLTWLQSVGGGFPQNDPTYTDEWLFDWVNSGGLARMAWNGYIEAPTHGSYRIEEIITGNKVELEKLPLIV